MEQSPMKSPNAMAEAAYTAAVAEMEKKDGRSREEVIGLTTTNDFGNGGGVGVESGGDAGSEEIEDVGAKIKEIWKSGDNAEGNMEQTLKLLTGSLDALVQTGLSAFYENEANVRMLAQSKEIAETRSREAQRLQAIDEQSRASLSNLLRAVESSKAEARDTSRGAQVEARLRTENAQLRDQRDKAFTDLSEKSRKFALMEEELRLTKTKLSRVMQEKIAMERDSRAAISLARSLDNNNSNDMNYYKRKVNELSDKVHSQQVTIDELRAKNERAAKKSRKSY